MFCICVACLVVSWLTVTSASSQEKLPSVNYWEITLEVVMNRNFAQELQISPSQRQSIMEMRSRKDLGSLIESKASELIERSVGLHRGEGLTHGAFMAVDDIVRDELSKILYPEQVKMLKIVKLRRKFPTGYSPFFDAEVLSILRLSEDQGIALAQKVQDTVSSYHREVTVSTDLRARTIVNSLRPDVQRKFVSCVGNKYLPGIPIGTDGSLDTIPFPPFAKSFGTLGMLCNDHELQKLASIRPDQLDRLKALKEKCDFENFHRQSQYKRMPDFVEALLEEAFIELSQILNKDQVLRAARAQAAGEFERNPNETFSRDGLIAFLALTKEEAESIRAIARNETMRHDALLRRLNQSTFDEIRKSLPQDAQMRLQNVFSGVWE